MSCEEQNKEDYVTVGIKGQKNQININEKNWIHFALTFSNDENEMLRKKNCNSE